MIFVFSSWQCRFLSNSNPTLKGSFLVAAPVTGCEQSPHRASTRDNSDSFNSSTIRCRQFRQFCVFRKSTVAHPTECILTIANHAFRSVTVELMGAVGGSARNGRARMKRRIRSCQIRDATLTTCSEDVCRSCEEDWAAGRRDERDCVEGCGISGFEHMNQNPGALILCRSNVSLAGKNLT